MSAYEVYMPAAIEFMRETYLVMTTAAAVFGLFRLFRKNREHERTITEMQRVVQELAAQARHLKDANRISDSMLQVMLRGEQNDADMRKLAAMRRRLEARPDFGLVYSGLGGDQFTVKLRNNGARAVEPRITCIEGPYAFDERTGHVSTVEPGEEIVWSLRKPLSPKPPRRNVLVLSYADDEKTRYTQEIVWNGGNTTISRPLPEDPEKEISGDLLDETATSEKDS